MYVPQSFRVEDRATLHGFVRRYSFASLVTGGEEPFGTHLPLLLDADRGEHGTLVGHFARANPHWRLDHGRWASVAMFHGPHAYVSPAWYRSGQPAVPTWNYAAVHATGKLRIIEDPAVVATILERTVQAYESPRAQPWTTSMAEPANVKLAAAVVAFEMVIDRMEGKFKLGQNRQPQDQVGAIEGLEAAGDADSMALARFARRRLGLPGDRVKQ